MITNKKVTKREPAEKDVSWRDRADEAKFRQCLSCNGAFESEGWHNRLCPKCRKQT